MTNGFHDHFCPRCGYGFICHKVTHCQDPLETLCLDHKFEPACWVCGGDKFVDVGDEMGTKEPCPNCNDRNDLPAL